MIRLWALTVTAGAALWKAPLPSPPLTEPGRLWSWWVQVGPLVGLFGGTRILLLVVWVPWVGMLTFATVVRSGRWAGGAGRLAARWGRRRGVGSLVRVVLGASASGGALAGCAGHGTVAATFRVPSLSNVAHPVPVGPPAPVLVAPPPAPVLVAPPGRPALHPLRPSARAHLSPPSGGQLPEAGATAPRTAAPGTAVPTSELHSPDAHRRPTPSPASPTASSLPPAAPPSPGATNTPPHATNTPPHATDTPPAALPSPGATNTPPGAVTHPAARPPPAPAASRPATTWTVRPGDDLWSIAEEAVSAQGGGSVAPYWVSLIEANRSRLPDPADPSLLFPGDVLVLPAPGS